MTFKSCQKSKTTTKRLFTDQKSTLLKWFSDGLELADKIFEDISISLTNSNRNHMVEK